MGHVVDSGCEPPDPFNMLPQVFVIGFLENRDVYPVGQQQLIQRVGIPRIPSS